MNLKQLINKSVYGTIGYISSADDLNLIEGYINYNLPVLKEYKQIIVATNYKDNKLASANSELWKKYFPDCILLDSKINRGHQIGTTDLDSMLFDYCKENNIEWLCKASNDIIITTDVFNIETNDSDFYYLMGFGYDTLREYDFNYDKLVESLFYPQTNFYFINISKIDNLLPIEELKEAYYIQETTPNYSGNIQQYIDEFCCERILKRCVVRNNLSKNLLISDEQYKKILKTIHEYNIHDPSHKNIMVNGICHFHHPNQQVLVLI